MRKLCWVALIVVVLTLATAVPVFADNTNNDGREGTPPPAIPCQGLHEAGGNTSGTAHDRVLENDSELCHS